MYLSNTEPSSFVAGEVVSWQKYLVGHLPKDGYELFYSFVSNRLKFDIESQAQGDHFLVRIPSNKTAEFKAGTYWWQAILTKDGSDDWHIAGEGSLLLKENLALTKKYDGRSHVKQVLDALEATILGKASRDQMGYSIAGRSISRLSPAELLKWRDLYKAEYARELQAQRLSHGLGGNLIKVRF